jgi:hypothetical protein
VIVLRLVFVGLAQTWYSLYAEYNALVQLEVFFLGKNNTHTCMCVFVCLCVYLHLKKYRCVRMGRTIFFFAIFLLLEFLCCWNVCFVGMFADLHLLHL